MGKRSHKATDKSDPPSKANRADGSGAAAAVGAAAAPIPSNEGGSLLPSSAGQPSPAAPPATAPAAAPAPAPAGMANGSSDEAEAPFFAYLFKEIPQDASTAAEKNTKTMFVGFSHKFANPIDIRVGGPGPAGGFSGPRLIKARAPKKKADAGDLNAFSVDAWSLPSGVASGLPPLATITTKASLWAWIKAGRSGFAHVHLGDAEDPFFVLSNVGVSEYSPELIMSVDGGNGQEPVTFHAYAQVEQMFKEIESANPSPYEVSDFPDTVFGDDPDHPAFRSMPSYVGSNAVKLKEFFVNMPVPDPTKYKKDEAPPPRARMISTQAMPPTLAFYYSRAWRRTHPVMTRISASFAQIHAGGNFTDVLTFARGVSASATYGPPDILRIVTYPSKRMVNLTSEKFEAKTGQLLSKLVAASLKAADRDKLLYQTAANNAARRAHANRQKGGPDVADRSEYLRLIPLYPPLTGGIEAAAAAAAAAGDAAGPSMRRALATAESPSPTM
jgi:hypothetical protein